MSTHHEALREPGPAWRIEATRLLELFAVCGFVFARPVLAAFGDAPEVALDASVSGARLIVFAAAWLVVPPLIAWAPGLLSGLFGSTVRTAVHAATIGLLIGASVTQEIVQATTWGRGAALLTGMAVALTIAAAGLWSALFRRYLRVLAIGPIVFAGVFLLASPTSQLIGDSTGGLAATDGTGAPVVMLVLDELPTASLLGPDGRIDAAAFPGFARLAAISTWYRNHSTVAPTTGRALPALVTGTVPAGRARAAAAVNYPNSLFTLLGDRYAMNVREEVSALCPGRLCGRPAGGGLRRLLTRSVDLWAERFTRAAPGSELFFDITAEVDRRPDELASWVDSTADTAGPRLDFAHVLLPHVPWRFLGSGRMYDASGDMGIAPFNYAWLDDAAARFARTRHLVQLQAVDAQIARLLDRLEARGTLDDTLIVVTADHGVAFVGQEEARELTERTKYQIASTPLLVHAPGQTEGEVSDRNAQAIDLLPTIAEHLGIRLPFDVDGISLAGTDLRPGDDKSITATEFTRAEAQDGVVPLSAATALATLLDPATAATAGSDEWSVLRRGPQDGFVGSAVSRLAVGAPASGTATFDEPALTFAPEGPMAPIVKASVSGLTDVDVALAVNDTVVGVYRVGDDGRVRYLVPDSILTPGENTRALFVVVRSGDALTLHPLRSA